MNHDAAIPVAELVEELAPQRRFRRYPEYRNSGIEWLGGVPRDWQVKRLRFAARINPVKSELRGVAADTDVSFVPMEAVCEYGGLSLEQTKPLESVLQGYTYFRDGDIVVAKITPCFENGKGSIAENLTNSIAFGTTELHVLRVRPALDRRFLFYLTISHPFRELGAAEMYGAGGQKRVPDDFLRDFRTPIPPLTEQRAIAAFLDGETARIDELIAKKQRLIELLAEKRTSLISHAVTKGLSPDAPMKDSRIDWVGMVPSHWTILPLKFVAMLQTGLTLGKKYDGSQSLVSRPYLRVANVQDGYLDLKHITQVELPPSDVPRFELRAGDMLMTEGGDFDKLGRGYVWDGQVDGCLHQNHIFALRPNAYRLNSRFLACLTASWHGKAYFTSTSSQTTNLASTNSTKLKSFPVLLPPVEEQETILSHIKQATERYDGLIDATQTGIRRLREYRSALITAAVMGKIDVQNTLSVAPTRRANVHFHRCVLAAEIIDRHIGLPRFGRIKLQKLLILAERHLGLDEIQSEPTRAAAGPFDNKMMRAIQAQLKRQKWFDPTKTDYGTKFVAMEKHGGHRDYFQRYWSDKQQEFDALIRLLKPMTTQQAEIVATLYMAWNDFIIEGIQFDDERLVSEVLDNWDESKQRIASERWHKAIEWMREKQLVPRGYGTHTKSRCPSAD